MDKTGWQLHRGNMYTFHTKSFMATFAAEMHMLIFDRGAPTPGWPSAGYPGELVYVSNNLPLSSFEFFTEDTYGIQYSQQSHTDIGKDSRPQSDESTSTGNQNQ